VSDVPDDVLARLGVNAQWREEHDEERKMNFEDSSVSALLKQIGWTGAQIQCEKRERETGFGWDWFNDLGLINVRCGSTREFRFDFFQLLRKPNEHPITQAFAEFICDSDEPACLIFYVYNQGRWVATNLQTTDDCSLHVVAPNMTFNVIMFEKFFVNRWGLLPPDEH
jgi:hypothetical protein